MTDQERIAELEQRLESLEKAVLALAMGSPIGITEGKVVAVPEIPRTPGYGGPLRCEHRK